jgi:hypothetical protein
MRDEMIPVKKRQTWFLARGRGVERELLVQGFLTTWLERIVRI